MAWTHRSTIDDGFIYLRVVHQVTEGHGPVFNVGERVEAFTGPLWVAVLSVADLLTPVRLEWLSVVIGIAATMGGLVLLIAGSAKFCRLYEPDALLVPFGLVVLVSAAAMWFYASSGLETGITFLWLGGCLWLLATWAVSTERLRRWSAVVLGLGWLVRPELVMYSITFLAVVVALQWRTDTWRERVRLLIAAAALPFAYQIFRMGYYGALVANTAIDKEGFRLRWVRGWRYFVDFAGTYWFVVPLVVMLVGGWIPLTTALARAAQRRAAWVVGAFVATGALNTLYVIAVGGDYEHARLLLPSLFALCAPIAVVPAVRRHLAAAALAPWAIAAIAVMRPPRVHLGQTYTLPQPGAVTTDDFRWGPGSPQLRNVSKGLVLVTGFADVGPSDLPLAPSAHDPTLAISGIGVLPYAVGTEPYVLDLLGLADPFTARLEAPLRTTLLPYPGHEKPLPRPWFAARVLPENFPVQAGQLPSAKSDELAPYAFGPAFDQQVAEARAVWDCPAIRQLRESYTSKLTVGRFLSNIVDSFANTRLRIPPDPAAAYRKFCGSNATPALGVPRPSGGASGLFAVPASLGDVVSVDRSLRRRTMHEHPETAPGTRHVVSVSGFV